MEKTTDMIINNIQIKINNVHIRYEDKYTNKDKVISFGIHIKSLKIETVNEHGDAKFSTSDSVIYKMGKLTGFNMYWNSETSMDSLISTKKDLKSDQWTVSRFI